MKPCCVETIRAIEMGTVCGGTKVVCLTCGREFDYTEFYNMKDAQDKSVTRMIK